MSWRHESGARTPVRAVPAGEPALGRAKAAGRVWRQPSRIGRCGHRDCPGWGRRGPSRRRVAFGQRGRKRLAGRTQMLDRQSRARHDEAPVRTPAGAPGRGVWRREPPVATTWAPRASGRAGQLAGPPSAESILAMQRIMGNVAVAQRLAELQTPDADVRPSVMRPVPRSTRGRAQPSTAPSTAPANAGGSHRPAVVGDDFTGDG
jgi:hypothetical protein